MGQLFQGMEPKKACKMIEKVIQAVEYFVFNPKASTSGSDSSAHASRVNAPQYQGKETVVPFDPLSQSLRGSSHCTDPMSQSFPRIDQLAQSHHGPSLPE